MHPLAYTISEACSAAAIGRTALYEAISRGELRAKKRGRRTLVMADDLRQWLDGLPRITPKKSRLGCTGSLDPIASERSATHSRPAKIRKGA